MSIDVKYLLPVFSLVFYEYYISLFNRFLFKLKVISCKPILTDGEIKEIRTRIILSYHGKEMIHFQFNSLKIKGTSHVEQTLTHEGKKYNIPAEFKCSMGKKRIECIDIDAFFENLNPRITIWKHYLYFFTVIIGYTINYDRKKTKEIPKFKIIKTYE
jgi:hypothetical protein